MVWLKTPSITQLPIVRQRHPGMKTCPKKIGPIHPKFSITRKKLIFFSFYFFFSTELEAMKQEILKEMRKEMAKMKTEIIEGACIINC